MRAVFALLLGMLGIAMVVVWMPDNDRTHQLAVITGISAQQSEAPARPGGEGDASTSASRTFSPGAPLIASVEMPGARSITPVATVVSTVLTAASNSPAATKKATQTPPVTTLAGSALVKTHGARQLDPAPASSLSHDELVRDIQRELRRVGCYAGEIDGDWGTGSRRAMIAFTDRVNASLPVYQPDFILLTLLKGRQGEVCNRECPQGQGLSDGNRCVPNAILAQARRPSDRNADRRPSAARDATPTASAASEGWDTRMTRATVSTGTATVPAPERSSTVSAASSYVNTVTVAAAPLPGRMSMGGPQNGGVIIYGGLSTEPSKAARDAVRSTQSDLAESESTAQQVTKKGKRRTARRNSPPNLYAPPARYGFAPTYYRAPRQAYYAPPRRARSWTGNFFGRL